MPRVTTLFLLVLLSFTLPVGCGDDDSERTDSGCCTDDSQCSGKRCIGGACIALAAGECFQNADCADGSTCQHATVCPCTDPCFAPTKAGTCAAAD